MIIHKYNFENYIHVIISRTTVSCMSIFLAGFISHTTVSCMSIVLVGFISHTTESCMSIVLVSFIATNTSSIFHWITARPIETKFGEHIEAGV